LAVLEEVPELAARQYEKQLTIFICALFYSCDLFEIKSAACERAADRRGSWVLIRSRTLSTHCQTAVVFLF
jgi:hypothetical protein